MTALGAKLPAPGLNISTRSAFRKRNRTVYTLSVDLGEIPIRPQDDPCHENTFSAADWQQSRESREMTIAELCVKRAVFPVMLVSFLLVLGIFSFRDLGVDLFPKADPAVVSVMVRIRGATPEEVLTQVTLPLEDAVSTISGIDELS